MTPTPHQELCLKGLFYHLVDHGFKLSVRDYIDGLKALRAGYGLLDRERLLWLCKTLWARTPEEERYITHLFGMIPRPSEAEINDVLASITPPAKEDEGEEQQEMEDSRGPDGDAEMGEEEQQQGVEEEVGATFADVSQQGLGVPRAKTELPAEDFILDSRPPVLARELTVILRRYRRTLRTGPAIELDIDASVQEICTLGVLHKPVYIPARKNQARLTVLLDVSDSMVTWRSFNEVLRGALRNSNLGSWALYYFNDVPDEELYLDEALHKPVSIRTLLTERQQAPLLIISDAGAARGGRNRTRIKETRAFLDKVRLFAWTPITWINPMPRHRWARTAARAITRQSAVPMFELTPEGLTAAVDVMRGTKVVAGGVV